MLDPRVKKQAEVLVDYSVEVKKGEKVALICDFNAKPLALEVYKLLVKRGASEIKMSFSDYDFVRAYYANASEDQLNYFPQIEMNTVKQMDCYIAISSPINTRGLTSIDPKKIAKRMSATRKITDWRVENTRWVITRYASDAQAQEADMSLEEYEDFVFKAIVGVNWSQVYKNQEKLRKLVDKTSEVKIIGKNTNLTLSVFGRKAENAGGKYNMPDGEVFTSVVEDSVNGYITYDFPALYSGREFHDVGLEFKDGLVVKATASKGEKELNKILDIDKGARRLGELGLGNNYKIDRFTKDILFDEKIGGTVHLALGRGYEKTLSKNKSAIHWDMIKDLRKGGELLFDGKVVQRQGKWVY